MRGPEDAPLMRIGPARWTDDRYPIKSAWSMQDEAPPLMGELDHIFARLRALPERVSDFWNDAEKNDFLRNPSSS